jgi:acetyl esterase/lipase
MPTPSQHTFAHGLWRSPVSAADVAAGARRFGTVAGDGAWVYWTEGRPEERGRQSIMRARPHRRGAAEELLPAPFSARSRVHEYGGGELLAAGGRVWFVNHADQDIYELAPGPSPRRLTSEPATRFADMALDQVRGRLICVAERHLPGDRPPDNLIVAIDLDGPRAGMVGDLVTGRDFYAAPRLSPDGTRLAYVAWDLPGMPWDEAELCIARLDAAGCPGHARRIAGGRGIAASHPAWAPDGTLVYVSDETGLGRLMAFDGRRSRPLARDRLEFGRPMWSLGSAPFTIDHAGTVWAAPIAARRSAVETSRLLSVAARGGTAMWHGLDDSALDGLTAFDGGIAGLATRTTSPAAVTCYAFAPARRALRLRSAGEIRLGPDDISPPKVVHFTEGRTGARVYALYYAPRNARFAADPAARPPAIVMAHGGPTSAADRGLRLRTQFYTSRGFAVLDVDYAGSTGYGRAYRERLDGRWGIADVADCEAGALYLGQHGLADPDRIAIAGGSAGGYTVLMALATSPIFAAGSSHYGISDLALLMEHTHKFESGYLHRLLGTTPKSWRKVCRERSPIGLIEGMRAPLILFQGLEDKVVPPEQSRLIHAALRRRGIMTELIEFAGEAHGFRRAETIIAVLEAELAFLRRALGLAPKTAAAQHGTDLDRRRR